jgi:hypothetical protein
MSLNPHLLRLFATVNPAHAKGLALARHAATAFERTIGKDKSTVKAARV